MATVRKNAAVYSLESQFPIVATNLRALVSSWLPPAREPSPEYDDNTLDDEAEGRPERCLYLYLHQLTFTDWPWEPNLLQHKQIQISKNE
jgi:hypothetical protein